MPPATHSQDVFIGGDVDLVALASSSNTAALLATGRVGLYSQVDAILPAVANGTLTGIVQGMANTGPGQAEINLQNAQYALTWFQDKWQSDWLNYGISPTEINVNIDFTSSTWQGDFSALITAAHQYNILSIAPIFSPNLGTYSLSPFSTNPSYASIRAAALLGGALTIDSPPDYFFSRGELYQEFIYGEIQWAHQNNLRVTVIVSPHKDDATFLYDAEAFVNLLQWHNATPSEWVVENYTPQVIGGPDATPGDPNGVGTDTDPNSMAGVALWIAQNALTTSAAATTPPPTPSITFTGSFAAQEAAYGAGVTITESITTTYLAGAIYVGVAMANGNIESTYFAPVSLDAHGTASFSIHLAHSGDYIIAENNLSGPAVLARSGGVTITEPALTLALSAPGTVQEASYGGGANVTETVTATNITGPIYVGVAMANGNIESSAFSAIPLNSGGSAVFSLHLAHPGDYIIAETDLSNPTLSVKSGSVTFTEPPLSIVLGAPGSVHENAHGLGVDINETVSTTNINGPIYVGVAMANGNIESSSFSPISLNSNGVAAFSIHFAHTGDYIIAETSLSNPALLVASAPVTLIDPPLSMAFGALGSVQEASFNAGVDVTETVATTNMTGPIYVGVATAAGNIESSSFAPVALDANGAATFALHLAHNGDYVIGETDLSNPALLVRSNPVTITERAKSITLGALGSVQEASFNAGVDVTETVATANMAGPVYVGVATAAGNIESSSFAPVALDANGAATFALHLAHNGDYILAEDSLANPSALVRSNPVTITERAKSITLGALGSVQEASFNAGVDVTETVATANMAGPVYVGVATAAGNIESSSFAPVALDANGAATFALHLAHNGDYILAEDSLANPSALVRSNPVTITERAKSITLGALGSVQEASFNAGVDVTETVATTNMAGPVYVGVATAAGNIESSSFAPVALDANGAATFALHLAHNGDYILAEDSLANPSALVRSNPVTITERAKSITLGALGSVQEASFNAGVDVTETVATANMAGPVYVGVATAAGNIESSSFAPVALDANGAATFALHLAHNGDYILAEDSLANPSALVRSNPVTITERAKSITLGALGSVQEASFNAGVDVTETVATANMAGPVYVGVATAAGNIESSSFAPVALDANGAATFALHLAHNGDYILAEDSLANPSALVRSNPVTITERAKSITLGALGSVQEASFNAGVDVTETVATANMAGPVYVGVATAAGNIESSSFAPVALDANGAATFALHLAHNGDYILAEDSLANPSALVRSNPVTITERAKSITLGALGSVQEASFNAGVDVTETVATANMAGPVYVGVATAAGNIESSSFAPVALDANGAATFALHLAHNGDYILAEDSLANPSALVRSNPVTITEPTIQVAAYTSATAPASNALEGVFQLVSAENTNGTFFITGYKNTGSINNIRSYVDGNYTGIIQSDAKDGVFIDQVPISTIGSHVLQLTLDGLDLTTSMNFMVNSVTPSPDIATVSWPSGLAVNSLNEQNGGLILNITKADGVSENLYEWLDGKLLGTLIHQLPDGTYNLASLADVPAGAHSLNLTLGGSAVTAAYNFIKTGNAIISLASTHS